MATVRVIYDLIARDHASRTFGEAGTAAGRLHGSLTKVIKAAAVAGAGLTVAAGAVGVEAARMATDFQASMEKVHTQAGASAKDVQLLSAQVLKLGKYAEQSPQQLADALFHLKSVGLDNVKAMRALRTAADLAAVGGANLEDTTNALAGAWRSGIKGAESFGKTAATVNAIIGAGNMRMSDFVDALSTGILPAARTFGVSLKSVGAALALMTDEGIPAQLAATRLRMTLSLMGAPSKKAAGQLASIGLSSTALAQAMRGPGGLVAAISLLKKHLDKSGLSATQAAALLSRAFGGGRSSSAILTMINNLGVMRQKQDQINKSVGKFGGAVKAQRKTAQAQFALLKSSLDVLMVKIGDKLLPVTVHFTRYLANTALPAAVNVGKTLGHLIPVAAIERDAKRAITAVSDFFAGLTGGPHPAKVGRLGHDMFTPPALPKSTAAKLGETIRSAFSGGIKAVNWGSLIARAIKAAVADAGEIGRAFVTLLGKLNWSEIGKTAAFVAVPFAISLVNNLVSALINEAVHHPLDLIEFIAALIPIGRLAGVLGDLLGKVPVLGPLVKMFTGPLEKAGGLVEKALGKMLGKVFGPVKDLIAKYFRGAAGWLTSKGDDIVVGLLEGAERRFPKLAHWVAGIGHIVPRLLASAGSWLLSKGADLVSGLLHGAERRFPGVARWLSELGGRVIGLFRGAGRWLLHAGGDLITGLLHGIEAKISGIWGWIWKVVVHPIISAVKHWFGIRSPSTVMAGIGHNLIGGLVHGLASHDPLTIARKVFGGLPQALEAMVSKGVATVASLPARAWKALSSAGSWLASLFGGGGSSSTMKLGQAMAARLGWTGNQWSALKALWTRESGWNTRARNPSSGAYGIPQALPASKMASAGADWLTNPATQIKWGLSYILGRYGSPAAAWAHETKFGWYKTGAWRVPQTGPAIVHQDEMVLPKKIAGAVRSALTDGTARGPLITIGEAHFHDEADLIMLEQQLNFAIISGGLGGA